MIEAVLYTSNTGNSKEYAEIIGKNTGLPCYSLKEAKNQLKAGAEIVYLGWIMAGEIKGLKNAKKKYKVRVVCGVGMARTGSQIDEIRQKNHISDDVDSFVLQGGFDMKKLSGVYKFMMNTMSKIVKKSLAQKKNLTPEEEETLHMVTYGKSFVSLENAKAVIDLCNTLK